MRRNPRNSPLQPGFEDGFGDVLAVMAGWRSALIQVSLFDLS